MRRLLLCTLAALPLRAAPLDEARRALDENIPQVAIQKLGTLLATDTDPAVRQAATLQLATALLDADRAQEALDLLAPLPPMADSAEATLLLARVHLALGHWAEAVTFFQQAAAVTGGSKLIARLGEAEALQALGRTAEAIKVWQEIAPDSVIAKLRLAEVYFQQKEWKKARSLLGGPAPHGLVEAKWRRYLEGRSLLAQEQAAPALAIFEELLNDPRGQTESIFAGATIGASEARSALHGREAGDNVLEDFIWKNPQSPYLDEMFARLDELYAAEENPSDSELQKLSQRAPRHRLELATFYYAKAQLRDGKIDRAVRVLSTFSQQNTGSPLAPGVLALLGDTLLAREEFPEAVGAFEAAMRLDPDVEFRAQMEIRAGVARFRQKEFLLAANLFRLAAGRSAQHWPSATFNSALAWLHLGNYVHFLEDYRALGERFPDGRFRRALLFEEGLLQARTGDPRATKTLELFAREATDRAAVAQARIAQAEVALSADRLEEASHYLNIALEIPSPGDTGERADYLAIFVADAAKPRDERKVIELCEKFLRSHPKSALRAEALLKLGQIYYEREDFANAQTQFEIIAEDIPGSPLVEMALFLAGKSAMRTMNAGGMDRALELFNNVAKLNGRLKLYARQEQAIVQSRLGRNEEAVILYDVILQENPEGELRFAALCGKADTLLAMGEKDPASAAKAVALYDQIAKDPEAGRAWRNQALYKKGKGLEKSDPAAALEAFYDVLQKPAGRQPEFFWYHKAGFDAGRLLEAQGKWESAIGIYEKMAKARGPRSDEARQRAEQLRLEHFIWE